MTDDKAIFARRCKIIRCILGSLKGKDIKWTPLEKRVVTETNCSPMVFYFTLKTTLERGWVKRKSRGLYSITAKGLALLEVL